MLECRRSVSKCVAVTKLHAYLKNLPPFFPMPVPERPIARTDFESGRHLNSLRVEKRFVRVGDTSSSFILLHEMTSSLFKSIHDKTTDSKPFVVKSEQPSTERDLTYLKRAIKSN